MKTLLLAAAALTVSAAPAMAQIDGLYVQGNLGVVASGEAEFELADQKSRAMGYQGQFDMDTAAFVSAVVGKSITPKWAVEGEVFYTKPDLSVSGRNADATNYGVLVNAKYEAYRNEKYGIYVGAGIGYGSTEYNLAVPDYDYADNADDTGVIWQLQAGVTYDLSARMAVDFGYRYLNAPEVSAYDALRADVKADMHVVTAGLRYKF